MATGADIPPELFRRILFDVCEDAGELLNLRHPVPNRKEAVKNITACSLTCVYWARFCREELFCSVWIKNYEDMRTFLTLVVTTPTRFAPISEYVKYATLVQRVGDRPWLHCLLMQPSLLQTWRWGRPYLRFFIEDTPNYSTGPQRSLSQRLFASLPKTPPSSCLQCDHLTIDNPHFVTHRDLVSFLQMFSRFDYLHLTNVAWSAQADFASDVLTRDPLLILPFSDPDVEVDRSAYATETAWVAFSTVLRVRDLSTQASTATSASEYNGYDGNGRRPTLEVLSSAQRAIFDICKAVCKGSSLNCARFYTRPTMSASKAIPSKHTRAYYICNTIINEFEPAADEVLSGIQLVVYGTQAVIPVTNVSDSIAIDSISMLLARILAQSTTDPSNVNHSSNELPNTIASPWPEIVGLCAAQPEFMRLQLHFDSHDHLVQFMEAERAALNKLDGRVTLFYNLDTEYGEDLRAADFETFTDLGDADEHDYINYND